MSSYSEKHPELSKEFLSRITGHIGDFDTILSSVDAVNFEGMATRESNGLILQRLWEACPGFIGGGADLITSNKFQYSVEDVFAPSAFAGRYVRHGIREHAMAAIANGLAGFIPHAFLPVTATFFMFYIYVRFNTWLQ